MTLPKLRELAEKAKAWRPPNNCREHPIVACGACAVCLGARLVAEDIARKIDWALKHVERLSVNRRWAAGDRRRARRLSEDATRIASYFGPPGDVEAFAAAVREMCNG